MAFMRSKQGLLLLIIIPGVLIAISQVRQLLKLKKKPFLTKMKGMKTCRSWYMKR